MVPPLVVAEEPVPGEVGAAEPDAEGAELGTEEGKGCEGEGLAVTVTVAGGKVSGLLVTVTVAGGEAAALPEVGCSPTPPQAVSNVVATVTIVAR